jgi:DNA ligase 1
MPDLADGPTVDIQGSAAKPYVIKNSGGIYSCSCPAWRNQSLPIDKRTCKHLRQYRGEAAEQVRIGQSLPEAAASRAVKQTAPALLLAHSWDNEQDLTGWWLSEKLDGVRCYWTGKVLLSRQGNRFYAPDCFWLVFPVSRWTAIMD